MSLEDRIDMSAKALIANSKGLLYSETQYIRYKALGAVESQKNNW